MNAQTKAENYEAAIELEKTTSSQTEKFDINDAHILRSKFIDNYARIEIWIYECASKFQNFKKAHSVSDNIKKIQSNNIKNKKEISELLDEFAPYIVFRGNIVHSNISTANDGNQHMIIYRDAHACSHLIIKTMGCISPDNLKKITSKLQSISAKLDNLTK